MLAGGSASPGFPSPGFQVTGVSETEKTVTETWAGAPREAPATRRTAARGGSGADDEPAIENGGSGADDEPASQVGSGSVHVLIATDADRVLDEVRAALEGPGTTFTVCRGGRDVTAAVIARLPDVAILDLQIGSMGGMAVTMALRLDESGGTLAHVPVVMLLDRTADVFLARRSGAESWLVKPLDALRLRRAVNHAINPAPETTARDTAVDEVPQDGEPAVSG